MKKLNLTLLFKDYYADAILLSLIVIGINYYYVFIIAAIYLVLFMKQINFIRLIIILTLILLIYFTYTKTIVNEIHDSVAIVNINSYEYQDQLTIRYHWHQYHIYVHKDAYEVGDILHIDGMVLQYRQKSLPYGFNQRKYYYGKGISGYIDIKEIEKTNHKFSIYSWRASLFNRTRDLKFRNYIGEVLFEKNLLDEDLKEEYTYLNVTYLINLTGIQLAVLVLMIKKILFYLNMNKNSQNLIVIAVLLFLSYLGSFRFGILRIFYLYVFLFLSEKFNFKINKLDLLFLIFTILLLTNIYLVYSQGFLITLLILFFLNVTSNYYQRYPTIIRQWFMSSLITIVILPFYQNINVLSIFLMPFFIILFSYVLVPMTIFVYLFNKFDIIAYHIVEQINNLIGYIASFNKIMILPAFDSWMILVFYIIVIFVLLSKYHKQFYKRAMIFFFLLTLHAYQIPRTFDNAIYFLDVGQGDTTFIHYEGVNILIDSYNNSEAFLHNYGIKTLDYLILTHSDEDHTREAKSIINTIDVKHVLISRYDMGYEKYNGSIMRIKANDIIVEDNIVIEFFNPIKDYKDINNNALVFKLTTPEIAMLFTGDIEESAEMLIASTYGNVIHSDILKIAHHGSSTSSTSEFLNNVKPTYAIISVGEKNSYGFPNDNVIKRLYRLGIDVYRTDLNGTIIYHFKTKKWETYL